MALHGDERPRAEIGEGAAALPEIAGKAARRVLRADGDEQRRSSGHLDGALDDRRLGAALATGTHIVDDERGAVEGADGAGVPYGLGAHRLGQREREARGGDPQRDRGRPDHGPSPSFSRIPVGGPTHSKMPGQKRGRRTAPAEESMELYDAMRTTFAAREFTDDPLPDAVLFTILDRARFAPSGGNRQGW